MSELRDYQRRSIEMLYSWLNSNEGHPCVVMPTGSGKSHVIAELCRDALQSWPDTRILMLTHVKELIEQNAEKLRMHWPNAPMGIYSASIGKRQLGEPITFAGIQSVRNKADAIGHVDLIIIDECHLVNHKAEGGYRKLIAELEAINPAVRVVGYSATPYRLGHGLITDKPAIFDALIEPVSIMQLVDDGYLSILRSKLTAASLDVSGVHKRGGEFIESELQAAVDTKDNNERVVSEVIKLAGDRKAWLFFCSGVDHSHHIADILNDRGIIAACITGKTPKREREKILGEFKAGNIRALTNANVLTTGFDYPDIDLIAMLRPTMSASLYVQMAGRGMRIKSHTDHCLVLDFAGVVETHGPITDVQPPKKAGEGNGEAPTKPCPECAELCAISARVCPACGFIFPVPEKKPLELHRQDIMGIEGAEMSVSSWSWQQHIRRASGKEMLKCTYYGALSDNPITEYFPLMHGGYAGSKAANSLASIARMADMDISANGVDDSDWLEFVADKMNGGNPPKIIEYKPDGKFKRIIKRSWQ